LVRRAKKIINVGTKRFHFLLLSFGEQKSTTPTKVCCNCGWTWQSPAEAAASAAASADGILLGFLFLFSTFISILKTLLCHILLAISILLASSSQSKKSNNTVQDSFNDKPPVKLSLTLDSINEDYEKYNVGNKKRLKWIYLKATLQNNTAGMIRYYSMSCSWTELFTTNSNALKAILFL
jgi:hypothetical protein